MADTQMRDLLDEVGELKAEREPTERMWDDIETYLLPNRSERKGEQNTGNIFDGTPQSALTMYASGTMGYLISSTFDWFSVRTPDESIMDVREVRLWLSKVDQILFGIINRSNFYHEMYAFFLDAGSIGTPVIYRYWDEGEGIERFMVRNPREVYLSENAHGEIDTVMRYVMMTNKQIAERFDNVHQDIKRDADGPGRYKERPIVHIVKPNKDYDPRKRDSKAKKYASWYVDVDHESELRRGGYDVMPYAVWRVMKEAHEKYGRGPGWNALADIKALHALAKTDITAAQLLVNPPLDIPEERRGKIRFVPGGRNYFEDSGRKIEVYDVKAQLGAGLELRKEIIEVIKRHYLVDFFMMFAQAEQEITATEVRQRREEKAVLLGPHITGLNHEVLDKIIDGLFADAWEAGMIPPPPRVLVESLNGRRLEVDYMGPLAQAQRSFFQAEPYRQAMGQWMGLAEILQATGKPADFLDNYNLDYVSREMFKAGGGPEEAMYDEKMVAKRRQQRAKEIEQQKKLAAMEQMGKAVPGLNQSVAPNSVLEQMGQQIAAGTPAA